MAHSQLSPPANPTEAANKTIITAIRSYVLDDAKHSSWDVYINELAFALNSSIHTATKHSPHHVLFGHSLTRNGVEHGIFDVPDMIDRDTRLKAIREKVAIHLRNAYEMNRRRYNLRSNTELEYGIGEVIYRRNMKQSCAVNQYTAKFGPKYIRTVVKRKVGTNTYELEDVDTGHVGVYHTRLLKK